MIVRSVQMADRVAVCEIYNHFVVTSHVTFEIDSQNPSAIEHRIRASLDGGYPYLIAEDESELLGFAYAHQYRPRPAYGRTVEISVYIKPGCERRGAASALYRQLLPAIFQAGFHTILAGIALPNEASVRLHEKFGFQKVAHFSEVGRKFDRWIDVGYWQLTAEIDRF
ncbi:MAG TPA: GNAT family N-acetyltransferase [Pyrinomonadaceae bacterium]|jgi:phosphinothricin acetyltransferase